MGPSRYLYSTLINIYRGKMRTIGKMNTEKDFWNKVDIPNDIGDCWLWTEPKRNGYGSFCLNYVNMSAHRWAYVFTYGSIGDSLEADHLCYNPTCVNPMHIEAVSKTVNIRRSRAEQKKRASQGNWQTGKGACSDRTRKY